MKICSKCHQLLPLSCFDNQSTGKDGKRADCKDCKKRFVRSKEGLTKVIFSNQKIRSIRKGFPLPNYTVEQLYDWMWNQPIAHTLYDAWVKSNYKKDLAISCDRIDDYKYYSLDNIQITTLKSNVDRYYSDAQKGINTKSAKSVSQYTLDGKYIQTFHSYSAAAKAVNTSPTNIRNVAEQITITRKTGNGTRSYIPQQAKGFYWK